jgi:HEPN domain-containing protein
MHWYASTHNLHKLLRYAAMVCYRVPDIFNRHSEEEAMLLQQLQDAYTGSRYKEDYQPSAITTRKALEKIKRLQQLIT